MQDLLREVKRQLKPLERQADAARRHGALFEELMILKSTSWKGSHLASEGLNAIQVTKNELSANNRKLKNELESLDTRIEQAENALAHTALMMELIN